MPVQMTIGPSGRLTIPVALRQQAGIGEGDLVTLRYDGNGALTLERGGAAAGPARRAIVSAVRAMVEAEELLKEAADHAPSLTQEMTRLIQVLHQAGVDAIEAKRQLAE